MSSASPPYCPDAGEFVRIDFDPQIGREQAGRRPALILSPRIYNAKSRLCVLLPVTNQSKMYPFEVDIGTGHGVTGVVLADQLKSMSWEGRRCEYIGAAPDIVVADVLAKVKALLRF